MRTKLTASLYDDANIDLKRAFWMLSDTVMRFTKFHRTQEENKKETSFFLLFLIV